ncbi:unnamed protein product [Orchesella dallaii]|uniref:Uncharacterized protein n=1 Tax=Orchesella dallaii TaxID=48710 RepID=A0ABP1QQB0_9HEXA
MDGMTGDDGTNHQIPQLLFTAREQVSRDVESATLNFSNLAFPSPKCKLIRCTGKQWEYEERTQALHIYFPVCAWILASLLDGGEEQLQLVGLERRKHAKKSR